MSRWIISMGVFLALMAGALAQDKPAPPPLKEDAPDRYVVVPGDTLWGIAGRFLNQPWRWPEIWAGNKDHIRNPHRIFPGDVIVINRSGPTPVLEIAGTAPIPAAQLATVRLSPDARVTPLAREAERLPIPAVSPARLEPFLTRPAIITQELLVRAPRILSTQENRVAIGAGNVAYVAGLHEKDGRAYQILRTGQLLFDPDTKEPLGLEAQYLGEARVLRFGEISTIEIVRSTQEIMVGDRLFVASPPEFPEYTPRAPETRIEGRIIAAYNRGSVTEVARNDIVALNRGTRDGVQVGHVLALYRSPLADQIQTRPQVLWGRVGPTGSDEPWRIQREQPFDPYLENPRTGVVWGRTGPTGSNREPGQPAEAEPPRTVPAPDLRKLPEERYGVLMVFRSFDRVSYAIILDTSRPVNLLDVVRNP
jgi:hypothetical protein